jgi:putative FmdB family regulatory protein
MPFYRFECKVCGHRKRKMLPSGQQTQPVACEKCQSTMWRDPNPPSTQVLEKLDNGLMAKPVERLADAERLYHERALTDPKRNR